MSLTNTILLDDGILTSGGPAFIYLDWQLSEEISVWTCYIVNIQVLKRPLLVVTNKNKFTHYSSSHYNDVAMRAVASQITGVSIVCSTACSGASQRKHRKLRITGLCELNLPVTDGFPSQRLLKRKMSIWWRHNDSCMCTPHISQLRTHHL